MYSKVYKLSEAAEATVRLGGKLLDYWAAHPPLHQVGGEFGCVCCHHVGPPIK